MLVRIIDALKGMSTSPELVTLTPVTPWAEIGIKKIAPNMVIATAALATFERVNTGFFHNLKGTTGSSALASLRTKSTKSTTLAEKGETICQDNHGYWVPPQEVATRKVERARLKVTKPA